MELWITGAQLVDGTGAPARPADVRVGGDRITAVASPGTAPHAGGEPVLDATGLVLTPGFIDIHTHSDVSVLHDPRAQSKVRQGVTTEVVGNCGFSPFPFNPDRLTDHLDLLAGIGDDPIEPDWHDLTGYAAAVTGRGVALNVAPLVGHGQLRLAVHGVEQVRTAEGLTEMAALLTTLVEQGAWGMSTGLTYTPSSYGDPDELVALCRVLGQYDRLYATHARGGGANAIAETARVARDSGAAAQFSHLAINHPDQWGSGQDLLDIFDAEVAAGVDIAFDVYPYDASSSALTQYLPDWLQEGGIEAMRGRLADPATAARALADARQGWGKSVPWLWDRVVLSRTDGLLGLAPGMSMVEAAEATGTEPTQVMLDLCRLGGNRVQVVLFYRTEQDMQAFLAHPSSLVGSDGSALPYELDREPHPRAYGAAARVLGRYVRDLGVLDLPTAVHKMSGGVADRLGMTDRGVVAEGRMADLVLFDPAAVADRATFTEPRQAPVGVSHVMVNGEWAVTADQQVDTLAGRVLLHS
ncbi:N-acyl-D-amino-acid deacylase family protein [Propionibacteriaceae bacterium Y2011]|uniref:N-acyl-D-amino-acid deacylase family protein n=1 Tax=Microlunatus sp. Y2014 TaxID=3418488 RepID=UPI003B4727C2